MLFFRYGKGIMFYNQHVDAQGVIDELMGCEGSQIIPVLLVDSVKTEPIFGLSSNPLADWLINGNH